MRQASFSINPTLPIMRFLTRLLVLPALVLGTTFCAKNQPDPTPSATASGTSAAVSPEPASLGVANCRADTTGTSTFLYGEAYNLSGTDGSTFRNVKSQLLSSPGFTISSTGTVSGTNDDARINGFSNNVNGIFLQYDDYLVRYGQYGAVENPDYIKSNVRDYFEGSFNPDDSRNSSLAQADKDQLRQLYVAAKPQLERALRMYDKLSVCEGVKPSTARTAAPDPRLISFEQYQKLPAAMRPPLSAMRLSGFFRALTKAVHIAITVVVNVVSGVSAGMKVGKTICGATCGTVGSFIGGAYGFIQGIIKVGQNKCQFGPC
jgi:hypothetical protein